MQSQAELICVDPAHVGQIWPCAAAFIRRGHHGDFDRTEREVLGGLQLLWLAVSAVSEGAIEAAVTTQLINDGGCKICVLVACSGQQRERWLPLLEQIEDYARGEGCSRMRIYGRKGWERVLDGYKTQHVVLEKQLIVDSHQSLEGSEHGR